MCSAFGNWTKLVLSFLQIYYTLRVGSFRGDTGDNLSYHNGMKFSTIDQDNDTHEKANCAKEFRGGWWWNQCHHCSLNGKNFGIKGKTQHAAGLNWLSFTTYDYSLLSTEMAIKAMK